MDSETAGVLKEQSERHHKALSSVEARYQDLTSKIDTVLMLLGGSLEKQGLVHRVIALENAMASKGWRAWWVDLGTKVVHSVVIALVIFILVAGAKGSIREIVREGRRDMQMLEDARRRKPLPCDSCAILGGF